jgi:hypothetical protein
MSVFSFHGRPCIVTGEQGRRFRQGRRWIKWVACLIEYLDDRNPRAEAVGQGAFKTAKVIRGPQAAYWKRVLELRANGMRLDEARRHAMAEAGTLVVE